ncbi:MAG TPA: 23S rRNA (uracil(1939)-C(5))-methyltransferase RlmD [Terriglobales bacterium]|nr:23S rRNA (uracil(1939)-C(5))-methyltransferase RlmD [Terriglobales bacterium]
MSGTLSGILLQLTMQLTIEKMIYGGDGLARLPADQQGRGKAVFVPFVLPGEQIEATLRNDKRGFAQGKMEKLLAASGQRVEARCPYFQRCGGCQYQHTNYEHQLQIKAEILKENLRRVGKIELAAELHIHPSPPWNYRNRTRLRVRTNPAFTLGYYKFASHELLPVEECPISSPAINRVIVKLWELGRAGRVPGEVEEIELFADAEDAQLLAEVYCVGADAPRMGKFLAELQSSIPEISGAVAFRAIKKAAFADEMKLLTSASSGSLTYRTAGNAFQVSAGAFFQVNRYLADDLVRLVTDGRSGKLAIDLYAGVGLFSSHLARSFTQVIAVEASPISHADLRYNSPLNVKAVRSTTEQYLTKAQSTRPDYVVVDPPRSGMGEKIVRQLADLSAPQIAYVSCDPATLARDLSVLLASGYRIEQAHFVDLFPQTFHLESVFHLSR